jgi:DNA primase
MLPSEEIKDKINIVDLIGEYVPLKKAGVNYRAVCPFHQEKTPSFMVSSTKQIWHCFGCGLGGDIFEFVKQIEGVEFPEALHILATRAGITLQRPTVEYQQQTDQKKTLLAINELAAKFYAKILAESQTAQGARDYLKKRGFRPETIKAWQLGWAPEDFHTFENFIAKKGYQRSEAVEAGLLSEKPASSAGRDGGSFDNAQDMYFDRFRARVMFPLFDVHGRVVGFTGRVLVETEGSAKYVNSPETAIYSKSHLIYGLNFAKTEIRKLGSVVVVEGNVDVITCHEAGFRNVVGSSGTAFTEAQLELLKRFTDNVSFAFDVDEAGLTATRRAVELALSLGFNIRIISMPKSLAKDPDELIRLDPKLWEQAVAEAQNYLDFYFAGIFANLNLESSVDKKQAVAELLPLLSLLPDPLDRAHYLQKLALKLGVDEKLLLELLNKNFATRRGGTAFPAAATRPVARKTRQELLERQVLGLLLKYGKNFRDEWMSLTAEDFTFPVLREIFLTAVPMVEMNMFELEQFTADHEKMAPDIQLLQFALENELSFNPDVNLDELKKHFMTELKFATTKRRMQQIEMLIKAAELGGRAEEAKTLSSEFNNLTQELVKYHVS